MMNDSTPPKHAAPKASYTLVCGVEAAEPLARALSVPIVKNPPSGTKGLRIDEIGAERRIPCEHAEDVVRCLEAAQSLGIAAWFDEEHAVPAKSLLDTLPSGATYSLEGYGGTLQIARALTGKGFVQTRSRYGEVVDRREITPEWVHVTSVPQVQGASPRLQRYLLRKRIGQLSSLRSPEQLARWLSQLPTPDWQILLPLEEQLGGFIGEEAWPSRADLHFGPWLVLCLEKVLFAEGRAYGDPPEQAWPFFRWDGVELCLVGAFQQVDRDIAVDRAGLVYVCDRELGELRIMAETGLQMLEKLALFDELKSGLGRIAPLVVESELGAMFSARAGAPRVDEASDAVITHHLGPDCWIRQQVEVGPNHAETRIVTDTAETLVELARLARELSPGVPMHVPMWYAESYERLRALHAAGLVDVQQLGS